ncbi:MFS transporter [Mycobacterium sp. ITM-2016-00317]|uniref:MFS transporter n=1 Tax=Mycobacterium sp. ITM-2016-00317 TaxID=2099694 RepID=UPI000D4D00E6|nr:MFS transporter [Mycobacterium sp. ITM-2016-00317]WNG86326.1 MFS transporter [Mycobacterium sp. ITM-2016-00317]
MSVFSGRTLPPWWFGGTMAAIFLLQVAVTLARPVSTYRMLALDAGGTALGVAAGCFALPPMLLAVGFGRWSEKHHPALLLGFGLAVAAGASFALVLAESVLNIALATTALGIGHMSGTIGAQSLMAQSQSTLSRINRFGMLTTFSALGQIVGPVTGGVIIGHSDQPSLDATSSALLVAGWVFVAGIPAAILAWRSRIQRSTIRTGPAQRVWHLLHRRGMPAALMTSFSAKSGIDLLLVYLPLLGAAVGLTPSHVGLLLGISSTGAVLARAATPAFVQRVPTLRLTVGATAVASACMLLLAFSSSMFVLVIAMGVLGFALGLSQTTTMDWVVNLVDKTSRGSALGLRVATNRLGQTFVLVAAGAVSGWLGVRMAFVMLAVVMLSTAASGLVSERGERGDANG